jgi:sensor histidine kinase YesM
MVDEIIFIDNNLISEADLCKVINEFLDNAIEWASEASQKKVSICFLNSKKSVSIIIENTFKEKPNMHLKNTAASWAEGREPGVRPAYAILSRYPNVLNNTFIQHQVFVQELQIIK